MSWIQFFLSVFILLQIVLFVVSFKKLHSKNYSRKIVYPLYVFGAFVWEDMFVLSLFWTISSMVLIYLNNLRLTLTLVLIFIIFREFGEMIYSLLQQFNVKNHRPYDFELKGLNNESVHIIYQVAAMSILVLAMFFLYILGKSDG